MVKSFKYFFLCFIVFSNLEAAPLCGSVVSLLGAAGSGKGTAGEDLTKREKGSANDELSKAEELGEFMIYSGGNLLRQGINKGDPVALSAVPYMKAGELVPSEIVQRLSEAFFAQLSDETNLVLDGSPRQFSELLSLDSLLKAISREIDIVIYFKINFETSWDRVSGRQLCPTCQRTYHMRHRPSKKGDVCEKCDYSFLVRRPDDTNIEVVRNRWKVFEEQTKPVLREAQKRGILLVIDGSKSPEEVRKELFEALRNLHSFRWKLRKQWYRFIYWFSAL